MTTKEAAERFMDAPWLADLDAAARQALFEILQEGRAPAGTLLISEGQPNDRVLFLIEGSVALTRNTTDQHADAIAELKAPTAIGVTSFFGSARLPIVNVRAATPVWFLSLDQHAYVLLRRIDPRTSEQFMHAVVRVLAERFDLLDQRLDQVLTEQAASAPRDNELAAFRARLFEDSQL